MYRIAVLGEYDSIYGFATLGLETFPVSDAEQGSTQLRRLAESGYAVIYVTESSNNGFQVVAKLPIRWRNEER